MNGNLIGGLGGQVVYQSAVNTTAFLANGTAGQVLQSNGTTLAPSWSLALVSTLPASPTDGQMINYLANPTNGVVWQFRYRTASVNTEKWEFVGGSCLSNSNAAAAETAGASFTVTRLASRLTLTAPLTGVYFAEVSASTTSAFGQVRMQSLGIQTNAIAGYTIQVQSTAGYDTFYGYQQNNYNGKNAVALTAGDTIDLVFSSGSAGQAYSSIGEKFISLTPLRVGP